MRFWVRALEALTFAFSISYFFFVSRPGHRIQIANAILFEFIHVLCIICPIIALGMKSSSKCSDTAFAKTVSGMAIILLL